MLAQIILSSFYKTTTHLMCLSQVWISSRRFVFVLYDLLPVYLWLYSCRSSIILSINMFFNLRRLRAFQKKWCSTLVEDLVETSRNVNSFFSCGWSAVSLALTTFCHIQKKENKDLDSFCNQTGNVMLWIALKSL